MSLDLARRHPARVRRKYLAVEPGATSLVRRHDLRCDRPFAIHVSQRKCDTPRFTEDEVSKRPGTVLEGIHIPGDVLKRICEALEKAEANAKRDYEAKRGRLEERLQSVRLKMDKAHEDKLNGATPEDFWNRKMQEWQNEQQQIQMAMNGLKDNANTDRPLDAKRILELANKACFLYFTQNQPEQAKLLKLGLLNCAIDELDHRGRRDSIAAQ